MAEEVKKISFGFSKSVKKPVLKTTVPQEQKKVDYIECLDSKAIKVIGVEEKKDNEPLVIPLRGSKTWHDRIVNKVDADIFEPKEKSIENGDPDLIEVKKESVEEPMETDIEIVETIKKEVKVEEPETPKTLEEQAAREILQDLQSAESTNGDKPNLYTLPLNESSSLAGEKESTLEDYENIPIDAYGMAMLRGMGWKPGKGIGKNEKLVEASIPSLRPKGMGLGADKVTMHKQNGKPKTKEEEDLKLIKGAFVKMIAGKQKDCYGQIEGLDDDAGRFIVKMALGGNVISLNESVVQAVTKDEYLKNGKVLNSAKYQEYKDRDKDKDKADAESRSSVVDLSDSECEEKERREKKEHKSRSSNSGKKKSKKQRRHSISEDSSSDLKSRKRKSSESSEAEKKTKKSKKSKKHKSRESSAERSSRKNRKKDKEREKKRDKRYSESPERRKHKKHKRSRSRSRSRSPRR